MNPFWIFLIFVPFALAVWFTWIGVAGIIESGSIGDYIFGIIIFASISMVLGYMLWRSLSFRTGRFDFPGAEQDTERERDCFGNMYLMIAYAVIGIAMVLLLGYDNVKGILGALGVLMGTTLLLSGIVIYRSRMLPENSIEYQLARSWYPRHRTVYFVLSGIAGAGIYSMYKFFPSWKSVSPWDIAGVLFLILCSCVWLFLTDNSRTS